MKDEVMWSHVSQLSRNSLKSTVGLFIYLAINLVNVYRCLVFVQTVSFTAAHMAFPMESIHKEHCVLEVDRITVEAVGMELAAIVIDNVFWCLGEAGDEYIEGMTWRFMTGHGLKAAADTMWAEYCK